MTSYHGGKQRIGRKIAEHIHFISIILEERGYKQIKGYCEPFCGMLGVYRHIPMLFSDHKPNLSYKAGDMNESVIMMWQSAQKGWKPPTTCTEKEYNRLKNSKNSALRCYIGHQYSFGGQYFNGYAPKYGKTKDSSRASNTIQKISLELSNAEFTIGNYTQFSKLTGFIIYCDPPYEDTVCRYYKTKPYETVGFNSEQFWAWCRNMGKNNIIFISSYKAPKDFKLIMSSTHKLTGISPGKNDKKRTENLYVYFS